jgi:hypothetical protein
LVTESLVDALLNAGPEVADVMDVPCSESERRMLASILLKEDEELSAERLEGAVRALRRIHLRRRLEQVQRELNKPGVGDDKVLRNELLLEKDRLSRALRDPSLAEDGLRKAPENKKTA